MSASASSRIGTKAVQNLDHRTADTRTGAVRTIQKARPSAEIAGKAKRTAIADITKAAMARFTKA